MSAIGPTPEIESGMSDRTEAERRLGRVALVECEVKVDGESKRPLLA